MVDFYRRKVRRFIKPSIPDDITTVVFEDNYCVCNEITCYHHEKRNCKGPEQSGMPQLAIPQLSSIELTLDCGRISECKKSSRIPRGLCNWIIDDFWIIFLTVNHAVFFYEPRVFFLVCRNYKIIVLIIYTTFLLF